MESPEPTRPAAAADDPATRMVRLTIPAKAEYITLCRLALTGLARIRPLSEETLADMKLAITEACSNSIRHAYGGDEVGSVDVSYELHGDRLTVEVEDGGSGFDLTRSDRRDREGLTEGGLGIAIIRAIADELELGPRADGTGSRLRFVKLLA